MAASPPDPITPLIRALLDVREILERARRTGDQREIEASTTDPRQVWPCVSQGIRFSAQFRNLIESKFQDTSQLPSV